MKAEILSECKLALIPESKHESILLDYFMEAYSEGAPAPDFELESMEAWTNFCSGQGRAYLVKKESE